MFTFHPALPLEEVVSLQILFELSYSIFHIGYAVYKLNFEIF